MEQKGHVFLCSRATEQECLDRNVFGGTEKYQKQTGEINKGDTLFLYNYQTRKLHGTFVATTKAKRDIVAGAWSNSGKEYPWQVRVKRVKEYRPISRQDYWHVMRFKKYPPATLNEEQIAVIDSLLTKDERAPDISDEFSYVTKDGHHVRSKAEMTIDNWLYQHRIPHAYEPHLEILGGRWCDFFIPNGDRVEDGTFIEFWGLNDKKYLKNKQAKQQMYKDRNLKLIELEPKDLRKLDHVLGKELL